MNKIWKPFLFTLLASLCWVACSDDDDPELAPLSQPTVENTYASVSSLTFQWNRIAGASQYAYELTSEALAEPKGGVISETSVTFTGLKDDTDYTLTVWAYAPALSDKNSASQKVVITKRTPKIMPLDVPTGLTANQEGANIVIKWDAVENAQVYVYSYAKEGSEEPVEGTTGDCELSLSGLSVGKNYTFTLYADTEAEEFSASPVAEAAFIRMRQETWRMEGLYECANLNTSWTATLVAYDDGSYTLVGFGGEGYDLEFAPSEDGLMNISNYYYSNTSGYYYVQTSVGNAGYAGIYDAADYCSFDGDKKEGEIMLCALWEGYGTADYDYFTWGGEEEETWEVTGTFSSTEMGISGTATLVYNGGGSYTLRGFCGVEGYNLSFAPSEGGSPLNIDATISYGYYYLDTGLSDNNYMYVYDASGYTSFEGNKDAGRLYMGGGYASSACGTLEYTFTWGGASGPTIDDLVGTYTEYSQGYDYTTGSWVEFADTHTIEITKVDDTTVQLSDFWGMGYPLVATVDMENRTLTFEPQTWAYYYTFCSTDGLTVPVVATIDETFTTITFSNWTKNYTNYNYSYITSSSSTLTKQQ